MGQIAKYVKIIAVAWHYAVSMNASVFLFKPIPPLDRPCKWVRAKDAMIASPTSAAPTPAPSPSPTPPPTQAWLKQARRHCYHNRHTGSYKSFSEAESECEKKGAQCAGVYD